MTDSVFTLKYVRAKNGFLYLPENYVRKMEGLGYLTPSSVLKLQRCEKKQPSTAYFSWRAFKVEGNSIGLSATYATKLGLRENECIVLHNIGDVPSVRHVQVTAVTEDDVEIVAQNAASLQLSLLDQVRVVWVGQLLTLWLSDAFSVTLRVDSLEPSTSVGKLEVLTEIEIDSPSAADQNLQTTVDNSQSSSSLKSDGTISSPVSPSLQDTSTKSSGWLSSVRSFFTGSIEIKADERTDKNEEENLPSHPNSIKCSRRSHGVFRIHPIEGILNHSNSCEVFLLERDIVNIFCGDTSEQMLHMIKIKSPKEMSVSRTPQTKTNGSDSITQLEVSSDKSVVVRVRSMEHQPQQNKFVHGTKRVFLPYNLRRTLGLDIGSRVELISCQSEDKTANPTRIVLTVHSKKNVNGSTMVRSFEHCVHSHGGGLLLCDGFLLTLSNESGSFDVRVQLFPKTVQSVVISKEQLSQTEVLARMAGPGSVELPNILHENISLKDNLYLRHLETLMDDALISLELTLGLNEPLIKDGKSSFARDNILLAGKKGSGKTSVAVAVCHTLKGPPHYVHSVTFKCRPLRGKKVETLLKLLLAHVAECVYYQPSVLILDDLECVASKAQEQDKDYFNRVGKMLLNLLQDVQSQHCVAFIGTAVSSANLCAPLVSARGTHFFNTFLELPELNKAERQGIIEKLFSQRQASSQLNNFPSETVITDCASRTDGYTCQDLVDLIDKAVFEAWKRTGPSSKQPILQAFDVDTAILESTPMQLRGVQLHKDSAHCWDDIGGLTYVKEVLVEVLQWPVMYPELFLDFPLRPQSGLLLYGAPGTGKTLLAGAVAHECGLNFISVKGPELLSKYIGASEESVRKIFQKAQSAKPCVLFFDEFDSLAPRRGHDSTGVTDRVVNQLLTQLDGVESLVGVWVMAATSRPDLLDPALLRPGRLDRSILCPLPDEMDRLSILKALSRKMKLDSDVDLTCIAAQSEHFTGADLQAVLYTAQLAAVEECQNQCNNNQTEYEGFIVKQEHLLAALSGTRPSLTWHERKKYQRIYDRFARSGQGDFSDDMAGAAQRATLA